MAELDAELRKVLKAHGLGADAVWKLPQSGKWVVYHWALERIAASAAITFDTPQIVEANGVERIAAVCVTGRAPVNGSVNGERVEWSIGEAAPHNNKNAYPWAMAEKRGKDRVILKLIGLHGVAYSEEEADDFKEPAQSTTNGGKSPSKGFHGPLGITELKNKMKAFAGDLRAVSDTDELAALLHDYADVHRQCKEDLPTWWYGDGKDVKGAEDAIEERRKELEAREQHMDAGAQA